jgi:hypothetical protein
MKQPLTITLAALVGAFGIYCTQSIATDSGKQNEASSGHDRARGPVGQANAEPGAAGACCSVPVPKFKVLGELTVSFASASAILPVGAYREIVLYHTGESPAGCRGSTRNAVKALFRANNSVPFGYVASSNVGRILVQGADLQLSWGVDGSNGCERGSATFVVAGVE